MRLALFQPDIPPNVGTLLRLGACLGVPVDIIGPCGFPLSDRSLKRAAMDYTAQAQVRHHADWAQFDDWRRQAGHRLVLAETCGAQRHCDFAFQPSDILMMGRESAGTPADIMATCDAVVRIPMRAGTRSLNVAIAAAIVLGEALRQTQGYDHG